MIRPVRVLSVAAALVVATAVAGHGIGGLTRTAATASTTRPAAVEPSPAIAPSLPAAAGSASPSSSRGVAASTSPVPAPSTVATVATLTARVRPDVLVVAARTMSDAGAAAVSKLSPNGSVSFRAGSLAVDGKPVAAVGVDPSRFRAFTAQGTAESDPVWQAVARGEAVASHATAKRLGLQLGKNVTVARAGGGAVATVRLGALATTGVPGTDLVVDNDLGHLLGLPARTGMLLTAGKPTDAEALAAKVRSAAGTGATVNLLTASSALPTAFLSGGDAAKAFGTFSYRYYPDGRIEPDPAWVRANIVTESIPIFGQVTCNRLMLPQLRGALQDVVNAGLASKLHTYDGCYNPRFIPNTDSISMHAWGIAIDMDASTNYRGIRGTMDGEIVKIFKRWGFRWGGDWHWTDPMHFEIVALMTSPKG